MAHQKSVFVLVVMTLIGITVGVFQLMNTGRAEGEALASSPIPASPTSKDLVVCMALEPTTLYVYGGSELAMTAVFHGIYENDYTSLNYSYSTLAKIAFLTKKRRSVIIQ